MSRFESESASAKPSHIQPSQHLFDHAYEQQHTDAHQHAHHIDPAIRKTANLTATKLETAAKHNDGHAYEKAMHGVSSFERTHTAAQNRDYNAALTQKLVKDGVLPELSLFETKKDFAKIDSHHTGHIDRRMARAYHGENSLATRLAHRGERIADPDGAGVSREGVDEALKANQLKDHLFAKGNNGKSLMDSLVDRDGGISSWAINDRLKLDTTLSAADRESLIFLRDATYGQAASKEQIDDLRKPGVTRVPPRAQIARDIA